MENAGGLTEYEQARQERIRQNQERMKAMDLQSLAASLAMPQKPKSAAATQQRGLAANKRKRLSQEVPRRRSARLQGEEADGTEIHSERQGEIVIISTVRSGKVMSLARESPVPQDRHPKGDIQCRSTNGSPSNDEAFLRTLFAAASVAPNGARSAKKTTLGADANKLLGLSLAETDVAKVTKNSVTHMAFMPVESTLVLAASDKRGCIGLWRIDEDEAYTVKHVAKNNNNKKRVSPPRRGNMQAENGVATDDAMATNEISVEATPAAVSASLVNGDDDEKEAFDGVLSFDGVHHQYTSGLRWGGASPTLFTCSYDGSIRRLDVERAVFTLAWGDADQEYSCFDVTSDGNTAYVGTNEGGLDVVDLRSSERTTGSLELHNRKINTVQTDPSGAPLLITSSTDSEIHLYDVRKLGILPTKHGRRPAPVAMAAHRQTCQAAYLAPDGSHRVVSTSFDDTIRIWDGRKELACVTSIKHDNQTGRWVMPFRAVWGAASDAVIVGNMSRYVDIFDPTSGKLTAQLSSEAMTAIAARNCVHPMLPVVASGTASGRLHVYR